MLTSVYQRFTVLSVSRSDQPSLKREAVSVCLSVAWSLSWLVVAVVIVVVEVEVVVVIVIAVAGVVVAVVFTWPIAELGSITCHMVSHSVNCYLTQANEPSISPASQTDWYLTYLLHRNARLSWPERLVVYWDSLPVWSV